MTRKHLSAQALDELTPPERGQIDIWDRNLPGFGIRLSQGGAKSWVVMVRRGERRVRLTLGPYPDLSLDAARQQALHYLSPGPRAGDAARPAAPHAADRPANLDLPAAAPPVLTPELIAAAKRALVLLGSVLDAVPALDSEAPSLPPPAGAPIAEISLAETPVVDQPERRRRILLAEDTETNRMVALAMLAPEPYDIDTANDGKEALEAAKRVPYDLILMDVSMPVMDGIAAARAIRALPSPVAKVPIIAMTAHAMPADRERCLAAGMNDYVSKPVSRTELVAKMAAHLSPRSAAAPEPRPAALDPEVLRQLRLDLRSSSLAAFIDSLLPDLRTRVHGIFAARITGNFEALAAHAHSLVGLAATFGARTLEERARTLEERARAGAADSLPLVDALKPVVEETLAALSALKQRAG